MAMSANAVLMKFFKLPPAVKMMLALMGFGSLATLLFTFLPGDRRGRMIVLGGIIVVALVIFGIVWLIRRIRSGKRANKLTGALESQGPTAGDIAEQQQIYREKFRGKLADLKTNGLDVYKLPWFVLMGEPGCGKTASLIHSGLDFPLGKDEVPGFGGTRNYNWWFTNNAVILDTAGRIAFHEEGTTDKVEWEYFVKLLRMNRPRCPINGVVIAIPADKLQRDSSEERVQKASILRDRLRQVHQLLGVRFPTFVLVTKMDLVGGFSEYFEEVRTDLQLRNQMFGWSRPGENFQDPYDPATFEGAFDGCYTRLRDWALRYLLQRTSATEEEKGMLVTFPESFRQLRASLNDYIGTVFQKSPLLEPPFFRGFYFTSAVQEGAPIFDVFSRSRAGMTISERAPKSEESKPFFIHDFYNDKVFPEQGLVFRSAKHVSLNRRMRRTVFIGGSVAAALMLAFFITGWLNVKSLITDPKAHCEEAATRITEQKLGLDQLDYNLKLADELSADIDRYEGGGWYARMLFIGANIREPQGYVRDVHAAFTLNALVRPIVERAAAQFRAETKLEMGARREAFIAALVNYTRWFAQIAGGKGLLPLDKEQADRHARQFGTLTQLLAEELDASKREAIQKHVLAALERLGDGRRYFARHVLEQKDILKPQPAAQTIIAAIGRIEESWKPSTQLEGGADAVKYWNELADKVRVLRERYASMLALKDEFGAASYQAAADGLKQLLSDVHAMNDPTAPPTPGTLNEAYDALRDFLASNQERIPQNDNKEIRRLTKIGQEIERLWGSEFGSLRAALDEGVGADKSVSPQDQVYAALERSARELSARLEDSLTDIRRKFAMETGSELEPLKQYEDWNLLLVTERKPTDRVFDKEVSITLHPSALGNDHVVQKALIELRDLAAGSGGETPLDDLAKWPALLAGMGKTFPDGPTLRNWFTQVAGGSVTKVVASGFQERSFWRPGDLYDLVEAAWQAKTGFGEQGLLVSMAERARRAASDARFAGVGQLVPGFDEPSKDLPFAWNRFQRGAEPPPAPAAAPPPPKPEPEPAETGGLLGGRRAQPSAETPPAATGEPSSLRASSGDLLFTYHTRDFLVKALLLAEQAKQALEGLSGGKQVQDALGQAADRYVQEYLYDWWGIYSDPTKALDADFLELLERCQKGEYDWPAFHDQIADKSGAEVRKLQVRMEALIRHGRYFYMTVDEQGLGHNVLERMERVAGGLDARRNLIRAEQAMDTQEPQGERATAYANRIVQGWSTYIGEVRAVGRLDIDSFAGSGALPALEPDELIYQLTTTADFPYVKPLLELSDYGARLLAQHLLQQLNTGFSRRAKGFPYGSASGSTNPSEFIRLLAFATSLDKSYVGMFKTLPSGDSVERTLDKCSEWASFLYGTPALRGAEPPPPSAMAVKFGVMDAEGNAYRPSQDFGKIIVEMPLTNGVLEQRINPNEAVRLTTDPDVALQSGKSTSWNPMVAMTDRVKVTLTEKFADSKQPAQLAGAAGNPGEWAMLQLLHSGQEYQDRRTWIVPIDVQGTGKTFTLRLVIQLERPYPGPIPALPSAGGRPAMDAARQFLTPK